MKLENKPKNKGYSLRFSKKDISLLCSEGCPPEKANCYNSRFNARDIACLFDSCSPEQANRYSKRFNGYDISCLCDSNCPSPIAEKYDLRFSGDNVASLFESGCTHEEANKYNKRFKGEEIVALVRAGCSSKKSDEYSLEFNGEDIARLIKLGYNFREVEKYFKGDTSFDIYVLYTLGLKPEIVSPDIKKKLLKLFENSFMSPYYKIDPPSDFKETELEYEPTDFRFLGTGISGIILLNERDNNAWKFSKEIYKEYSLLKKIQEYHKNNQKKIIKLKGRPKDGLTLAIEYIRGNSLQYILEKRDDLWITKKTSNPNVILRKHSSLPKAKILKYGSDIINGLVEMRQAGVWYHRDIRPANVMIDEKNGRAVIIDFGIATRDRYALPKDNRRYGGTNDLVALGQVMYKMTTGSHIFAESKSMEKSVNAQKIKDYRDKIYSDRTGKLLEEHIKQVDLNIQDEQLKTLIKACLTAKNCHYKKIQRMFKKINP